MNQKSLSQIQIISNKKIGNLIVLLLSLFVFFYINDHYFSEISNGGHKWKTGDWLINYSAGYVRRGLFGEFTYELAHTFNLNLLWTTATIQAIVLSLVYYFVLSLYFKSDRSRPELVILVSPAFLLFYFNDIAGSFRKELLLFLAFMVFLHFLAQKKLTFMHSTLVISLYAFAAFSHELAAFYLPFFLVVSYLFYQAQVISKYQSLYLYTSFTLIAFFSALSAILFSGIGTADIICNDLIANGIPKSNCDGGAVIALNLGAMNGINEVTNRIVNHNYINTYLQCVVLASIPFVFFEYQYISRVKIILFLVISVFSILPLFIVAIDWGRWIQIYFFLLSTLVLTLATLKLINVKYNFPLSTSLIVIYAIFWQMKHCCKSTPGGVLGPINKYIVVPLWNIVGDLLVVNII